MRRLSGIVSRLRLGGEERKACLGKRGNYWGLTA